VKFGSALPEEINKKDEIDLSLFDSQEDVYVSTKHVAEIVEARLEEIFSFVNEELKKIHREGLLPGGVVLSGGGSLLPGSIDLAKRVLRLPSQIGYPKPLGGMLDQVDTPPFSTVVGLLLLAQTNSTLSYSSGKGGGILPSSVYGILEKIRKWLKQFLP